MADDAIMVEEKQSFDLVISLSTVASEVIRSDYPELTLAEVHHPTMLGLVPIPGNVIHMLVIADNIPSHHQAVKEFVLQTMHAHLNITVMCPAKADMTWDMLWADVEVRNFDDNTKLVSHEALCKNVMKSCKPNASALRKIKSSDVAIRYFNRQHFVVCVGGQTVIGHETSDPQLGIPVLETLAPRDFHARYGNWTITGETEKEKVPAACAWLKSESRRQYDGVIFDPTCNKEWAETRYNLFTGFRVQPIEGDASVFWEHVFNVICRQDQKKYRFLRSWLAHLFQKPEEKPATAIVLQGIQGTGKTLFAEVLQKLIGSHFCKADTISRISGRFNSNLATALLVYVDELNATGRNQHEVMERLKSLTGSVTVNIEFKGKEPVTIRNFSRIMMSTNEDAPLRITDMNRRFWFYRLDPVRCNDSNYFARFVAETSRPEVLSAIMFDLLTEDISEFNPNQPPDGDEAFEMALQNSPAAVRWMYDELRAAGGGIYDRNQPETPCNISSEKLNAAWSQWCEREGIRGSFAAALKELRKLLPKITTQRPAGSGGLSVRIRYYTLPSLVETRRIFCRRFNLKSHDWDGV